MAIDLMPPILREIVASTVPQSSLIRRDRELQLVEGQPPMGVASTEGKALRWPKCEELGEKRRRPKKRRASEETAGDSVCVGDCAQEDEQTQECATPTEEETGTLFNDRS